MQSFVPKNRRPRFDLTLHVLDLVNVPLVSGTSFVKWHLPSSNAAEHRGKTLKCTIKDHRVVFDYEKTIPVRLVVGKDQMLQETWIHLEVLQEYQSGGRGERISLGLVKLNLAEYVDAGGHDDAGTMARRYLMQDSKINSTLKVGLRMHHVEGDRNYVAPTLRSAPVFGGIAGIMTQEAEASDDTNHMPSLSSKSKDVGELQDMYRRTLAASWLAQPGELKADDCIEDIFAGGDGWGSHLHRDRGNDANASDQSRLNVRDDRQGSEDDGSRSSRSPSLAHMFGRRAKGSPGHKGHGDEQRQRDAGLKQGAVTGRASLEHQARAMRRSKNYGPWELRHHEVDEFCNPYKEDLRSWKIRRPEEVAACDAASGATRGI